MAKQHLLIVDSDPKSLRVLEVSLKKAGFSVTRAANGLDAIEKIQISVPDMIITETTMPEMNGFELIERLRDNSEWQDIPVMFLTAQKSIEDKIRGLEQGVEDYLTKPIFIREILARVSLVMQRRQREKLETRGSKTEFAGNLSDMGIIDLIQTIDISQKSGVIHVEREGDAGDIFFRNGKVIDASTSSRKGEEAVYRMLVWSDGHFHIEFKNVTHKDSISLSTQGLLMEGMRRLDEWGRLQEQLPSLNSIFDIDDQLLAERLGEIPDEINTLLKHFDGRRSLMEVVNLCPLGDLEALTIITKLYFEGLIYDMGMRPEEVETAPPKRAPYETDDESISPDDNLEDTVIPADSSDIALSEENERKTRPPSPPQADEYRLSPPPGAERQRTTIPPSGVNAAVPSEHQTMMLHVSRTPTNPPPTIEANQSNQPVEASNRVPMQKQANEAGASPNVDISDGQAKKRDAGPKDTSAAVETTIADQAMTVTGMAAPTDFDEMVTGTGDVDMTTPTSVVDEDEFEKSDESFAPDEETTTVTGKLAEKIISDANAEQQAAKSTDVDAANKESEDKQTDSGAQESAPADELADEEEDALEDEWAELDSAASRGTLTKILIAAALVIVLGGGAAVIFGTHLVLKPGDGDAKVSTADKTGQANGKPESKSSPSEEKPEELIGSATDSGPKTDSETIADNETEAIKEPENVVDSETVSHVAFADSSATPAPIDEATMAEYKKLLKKASNLPRPKQLKVLESAIALNPNGVEAMTEYALAAMERRKFQKEALSYALKATALDPGNARAWLAIGYIYQLQNKTDESKAAYKKCSECEGPADYVRNCKMLAR